MIGSFHQEVASTFNNCMDLGSGGGMDLVNRELELFAEIKNKFNTTKGNHKATLYDDIKSFLKHPEYKGFTGYYVEVIPQKAERYNKPFTPSKDGKKKTKNERIRVIDGWSFYDLLSGHENTLEEVYAFVLETLSTQYRNIDKGYKEFFIKAYQPKV